MAEYIEDIDEDISITDSYPFLGATKVALVFEDITVTDDVYPSIVQYECHCEDLDLDDDVFAFAEMIEDQEEDLDLTDEVDEDFYAAEIVSELLDMTAAPGDEFTAYAILIEDQEEDLDLDAEETGTVVLPEQVDEDIDLDDDATGIRTLDEQVDEDIDLDDEHPVKSSSTGSLTGMYRVLNETLARWEIYLGTDAMPDLTDDPIDNPPHATFTTSPHIINLAPNHTYYIVTRYRNEYGLLEENFQVEVIRIGASGEELPVLPSEPQHAEVVGIPGPGATGDVRITALYNGMQDDEPADKWRIYISDDGTDPDDPSHLYDTVDVDDQPVHMLRYDTSTGWVQSTLLRILVKSYRSADDAESPAFAELQHTIDLVGPTLEDGDIILGGRADG